MHPAPVPESDSWTTSPDDYMKDPLAKLRSRPAAIEFSVEMLEALLHGRAPFDRHLEVVDDALPPDARILTIRTLPGDSRTLRIVLGSKEFPLWFKHLGRECPVLSSPAFREKETQEPSLMLKALAVAREALSGALENGSGLLNSGPCREAMDKINGVIQDMALRPSRLR